MVGDSYLISEYVRDYSGFVAGCSHGRYVIPTRPSTGLVRRAYYVATHGCPPSDGPAVSGVADSPTVAVGNSLEREVVTKPHSRACEASIRWNGPSPRPSRDSRTAADLAARRTLRAVVDVVLVVAEHADEPVRDVGPAVPATV